MTFRPNCLLVLIGFLSASSAATPAAELPGTKPLTEQGDLSAKQVDGMHRYLDRELAAAPKARETLWKFDTSSPEAYARSVAPLRDRFRKYLGVVDARVPPHLEYVSGPGEPSLLAQTDGYKVHAVRWAVLPGVDAEGLLIEPKDKPVANVVAIPHADQTPEAITFGNDPFALTLARRGCRVLVPTLIDRNDVHSGNPKLNRATNLPHREFVHRMAYEMGRTLPGYEVQKVLAAVDWFAANDKLPVGVIGYGDGGMLALYAAALDERIKACEVAAYFAPREGMAGEPIDCNVWGRVKEFGDAELALLVTPHELGGNAAPRKLILDPGPATQFDPKFFPTWAGPKSAGRGGAAPGTLSAPSQEAIHHEAERWYRLVGIRHQWAAIKKGGTSVGTHEFLTALLGRQHEDQAETAVEQPARKVDAAARQKRQFDQLVAFTQKLWRDSEATRKAFWAKADASSPAAWEKSCEAYRDYFHNEVIGKLPEPTMTPNPRTRQVYDEPTWTGYEVMLDVYPDVFAYGILLLPKNLKPGEKRPVVVCQHGLEGTPRSTIDPEKNPVYAEFSKKLAEQGYIVYAPQNPYYGKNVFRQLQRKANPLKLSLFSFIIRQHQRTIDWLETLPNVDPKRIGFYGLSYGGKTAMRVPAVEKRYCLSICSGDFNEWIGKNVSVDLDRSYMWTGEYEMYEFDLGNTFNYAEMAYLIAPRPFMVERGHDDGVGTDEMVSYEYARVRYLYANRLKIADRTEIEYQVGGHRIFGKRTYAFLAKHLNWKP
jgi:dienelactone hydrolase